MSYKLFLDDVRTPLNCISYMHQRIGKQNPIYLEEWVIAKTYNDFVRSIEKKGLPEVVSFDHDLADEHYDPAMADDDFRYNELYNSFKEKTGYDAAVWLVEYCNKNDVDLPICFIHSMNPVGCENIKRALTNLQTINKCHTPKTENS